MRILSEGEARLCELQNARDEYTRRLLYAAARNDHAAMVEAKARQLWAQAEIDRLLATAAPLVGRGEGN